jgi:nucleoside-diphosphate-sugar epimerase
VTVLVTGANGYVGRRLVSALLADTDEQLVLCVRDPMRGDFDNARVTVVAADLCDPEPFATIEPAHITSIVHAAAVVRFNVDEPTARRVNVDGTATVCEFARRCPRLERLAVLSSIYSAGRSGGLIDESAHSGTDGFVNHYEWSKWEAERRALQVAQDVPVTIMRLATVIADSAAGTVTQYNAFHHTLKLYYYGLLSLVPGEAGTPIYLVTGDFVVAAVMRLLDAAAPLGIFHVTASRAETLTLAEMVDVALTVFDRHEDYRRRRLLPPLFCDQQSLADLLAAAETFSGSPINQALRSVAPFASQLYVTKDVSNERLRAAWPDYAVPDARSLMESTCEHLARTRWGRTQRRGAEVDVQAHG